MSYDTWLEGPYIDKAQSDFEHEKFQQSAEYATAFDAWLLDQYEQDEDDE